jgi:hypothetical protein
LADGRMPSERASCDSDDIACASRKQHGVAMLDGQRQWRISHGSPGAMPAVSGTIWRLPLLCGTPTRPLSPRTGSNRGRNSLVEGPRGQVLNGPGRLCSVKRVKRFDPRSRPVRFVEARYSAERFEYLHLSHPYFAHTPQRQARCTWRRNTGRQCRKHDGHVCFPHRHLRWKPTS